MIPKRLLAAAALCVCATVAHAARIEISTVKRVLVLHQDDGTTKTYPIAVGIPEEQWHGVQTVTRKAEWPDWYPTADTRRQHPELPEVVRGGPKNPLGARALYLGDTLYRIHGTNAPKTIGRAASGGCFRMRNADVIDLYQRVPVGTTVTVLNDSHPAKAKGQGVALRPKAHDRARQVVAPLSDGVATRLQRSDERPIRGVQRRATAPEAIDFPVYRREIRHPARIFFGPPDQYYDPTEFAP